MERWQNKVAVVTGASSGIGAATAADLVKSGFQVVALARREDRLLENKLALPLSLQPRYHPRKCDVCNEDDVKQSFAWIEENLGGTDVLINNAGISHQGKRLIDSESTAAMEKTVETNISAVIYCVREAFNSMKNRNVDGHIVIINSILGHVVPYSPGRLFNVYPATKHAVTALVETYRQEFVHAGTKVKITSISPGLTDTEIIKDSILLKKAGHSFLQPNDVSDAVLYVLQTPPHVQVQELIIKPIGESF